MAITLGELLSFDVLRDAQPEVLCGGNNLDRDVRWVHSSEIYEIAPLLSGGELLLTTGLGLAGVDAGARRHYVRELAKHGVCGLAMEVGRTFVDVPFELVEEARKHNFPLIALRQVVPFVRITEMVNTVIVDYSGHRLRLGEVVTRALNEALIAGAGVGRLLTVASSVTACPLILVSAADALVAAQGVPDNHAAWTLVDSSVSEAAVTLHDERWGRLVAGPGSHLSPSELDLALERIATAVALAVLRTATPPSQRDRQAAALLADLLDTDAHDDDDLAQRATIAGFHPPPDRSLVGVAIRTSEPAAGNAIVDAASRILGSTALRGRVGQLTLGVLVDGSSAADTLSSTRQAVLESMRRAGSRNMTVAIGLPVQSASPLSGIGRSLREARTLSALVAGQLGERTPPIVVDARSRLPELMLSTRTDDQLRDITARMLGGLITWDSEHRSDLVHTLEVYERCGASATRAAKALQIGRQAMYQRIERIETLLGHSITDPQLTSALLLAACAHRMRIV